MKIHELIDALQELDPELEVLVEFADSDYFSRVVAVEKDIVFIPSGYQKMLGRVNAPYHTTVHPVPEHAENAVILWSY